MHFNNIYNIYFIDVRLLICYISILEGMNMECINFALVMSEYFPDYNV